MFDKTVYIVILYVELTYVLVSLLKQNKLVTLAFCLMILEKKNFNVKFKARKVKIFFKTDQTGIFF